MKPHAALILSCLWLSGCQTPEQIAAQQEMQRQQDNETCLSYGFRPRSDAFRNCLLQLNIARDQQRYYNERSYYGYGVGYYPHHHGSGIYYLGH